MGSTTILQEPQVWFGNMNREQKKGVFPYQLLCSVGDGQSTIKPGLEHGWLVSFTLSYYHEGLKTQLQTYENTCITTVDNIFHKLI